MVSLYAARVSDLGPNDRVNVECRCGHVQLLPASYFVGGKVSPDTRIGDLERRFRCRECDRRGEAIVMIAWADRP